MSIGELFFAERPRRHAKRDAGIVERYKRGESAVTLAKSYRLSVPRVARILADAEVTRDRTVSEERLEQVRRLHAEGKRDHEIAGAIGVGRRRAAQYREELGLPPQPPHRKHPKPEPRECALEGCNEIFTPTGTQVAQGYGDFHSRACARQDERSRSTMREHATAAHRVTKEALEQLKVDRDVVSLADISAELKIAENTLSGQYIPGGHLSAERCQVGNEIVWLVERAEYERFKREAWPELRRKAAERLSTAIIERMAPGRSQVWHGRVNGHLGAAAGMEHGRAKGGRPPKLTPDEQTRILDLDKEKKSTREIAEEVLGDRKLHLRVWRYLNR